jgi:hypothetical protein
MIELGRQLQLSPQLLLWTIPFFAGTIAERWSKIMGLLLMPHLLAAIDTIILTALFLPHFCLITGLHGLQKSIVDFMSAQ